MLQLPILFFFKFKCILLFLLILYMCAFEYQCPLQPGVLDPSAYTLPKAGAAGGCELLDTGAGSWTDQCMLLTPEPTLQFLIFCSLCGYLK